MDRRIRQDDGYRHRPGCAGSGMPLMTVDATPAGARTPRRWSASVDSNRGPHPYRGALSPPEQQQNTPPRRYRMKKITDAASSAPMATLKSRKARSDRRTRCKAAPKASQGKQLGRVARKNTSPRAADWPSALPAPSWRKVAPALARTNHDFGLTH